RGASVEVSADVGGDGAGLHRVYVAAAGQGAAVSVSGARASTKGPRRAAHRSERPDQKGVQHGPGTDRLEAAVGEAGARTGGGCMTPPPHPPARRCTWYSSTVEHRRIGSDGVPRVIVRDPQTGALLLQRCSCWKPLAHASQRLRPRRRRWTLMDAV